MALANWLKLTDRSNLKWLPEPTELVESDWKWLIEIKWLLKLSETNWNSINFNFQSSLILSNIS